MTKLEFSLLFSLCLGATAVPALADEGINPLQLDSKAPSIKIEDYAYNETRYRMLVQSDEARAEKLIAEAREDVDRRWQTYSQMAAASFKKEDEK